MATIVKATFLPTTIPFSASAEISRCNKLIEDLKLENSKLKSLYDDLKKIHEQLEIDNSKLHLKIKSYLEGR